jgi:putative tryptophan/tyrosine transport system substrate-binding protein
MQRRQLIVLFLLTMVAWPNLALAQVAATVPRIAIITVRTPEAMQRYLDAFAGALYKFGLVRERDYTIDLRSTGGDTTRDAPILAELITLNPAVIMTTDTPLTLAAKHATKEIPIVGVLISDPVGFGLVASLAHPGGNVTGLLSAIDRVVSKQLELLRQAIPAVTRVGMLFNANNPANVLGVKAIPEDAAFGSLKFVTAPARQSGDIDPAFLRFARERVEAVLVFQDGLFSRNAARIAKLALAARLPTVFGFREFVEDGGLMSYGLDLVSQWQRAAAFVDKILKGTKPADLPVEMQPRLELVINAKTAKALGLTIPPSLLAFADDVID